MISGKWSKRQRTWEYLRHIVSFQHTYAFWCHCCKRLFKTLLKKEKLLTMSNSCFCHTVFNSIRLLFFNLYIFSKCCLDVFKGVCCRCVVCVKGLAVNTWAYSVLSSASKSNTCSKATSIRHQLRTNCKDQIYFHTWIHLQHTLFENNSYFWNYFFN